MTYVSQTTTQTVSAIDIPTMEAMSTTDYAEYIQSGLLSVDHHGILRSEPDGYPLATSKTQLRALVAYLVSIEHKVGGG